MKVTFDKEVGTRLNEFVLILKISQNTFAQSVGVTKGYLNDVLKGRKGIGAGVIINTAKAYRNLNIRWLLTGEGEMLHDEHQYPPPSDWLPDVVLDGELATYLKQGGEGELERIKRRLNEHEARIRALEHRE